MLLFISLCQAQEGRSRSLQNVMNVMNMEYYTQMTNTVSRLDLAWLPVCFCAQEDAKFELSYTWPPGEEKNHAGLRCWESECSSHLSMSERYGAGFPNARSHGQHQKQWPATDQRHRARSVRLNAKQEFLGQSCTSSSWIPRTAQVSKRGSSTQHAYTTKISAGKRPQIA